LRAAAPTAVGCEVAGDAGATADEPCKATVIT
jgi:hypothetical protein